MAPIWGHTSVNYLSTRKLGALSMAFGRSSISEICSRITTLIRERGISTRLRQGMNLQPALQATNQLTTRKKRPMQTIESKGRAQSSNKVKTGKKKEVTFVHHTDDSKPEVEAPILAAEIIYATRQWKPSREEWSTGYRSVN